MELIINTFGTLVSKENDNFVIKNSSAIKRIPPDTVKSIIVSKGVQITSDAIILAIEKEIDVIFTDKSGMSYGRVWSNKYGSISTIRKGQVEFSFSKDAIDWVKESLQMKIENQQALLLIFCSEDYEIKKIIEKKISKLNDYITKIKGLQGDYLSDISPNLRGWEALSSKQYFKAMNLFLPEKFKYEERSQHPALDIVNCMLNYSYGMLYGKIEGELIKCGIDPYVGVFHRDDYNRPVLVYDIIERYRIWADFVVYSLAIKEAINEECFSIKSDGSYWLESLGRRILIQSINDYIAEVVNIKGVQRSRMEHLRLYVQSLAQKFKKY